jgi:hypothetical protein
MGGVHFLRVVFLLIYGFSHTQAYSISSETCQNYGLENLDLTTWLQEAMEEAKGMAALGQEHVKNPGFDPMSNFHKNMLPELGEADLEEVKGTRTLRPMIGVQGAPNW